MLFYRKPRFIPPPRQAHPLLRRGWGGAPIPPFLYSSLPPSKAATSLLFVVHPLEISPSTSHIQRLLQCSSPANHDSQPYPARHIPSFGGAWGGRPLFFKYFHPLPYSLSNIENMSVLFSGKILLFCSSCQLLLLQSTNLLLFISSLLHALMLPICSLSPCCVFLFPLYYNLFLYLLYNINIYKRINLFIFICFYPLCYLLLSIKIYIIKNVIMCLLFYVYALKVIYINI